MKTPASVLPGFVLIACAALPAFGAPRPNVPASEAAKLPRGAAIECADVPDNAYGDGKIADETIQRLRAAKDKPGKPWFLAVGFLKPHLPFVAPKKYWDLYDRASFQPAKRQTPPEGAPPFAPTSWGELRQYSDVPETGPLTPDQQRHLIHGYHAAVSYMDAQLGRVLDELDRLGLAQNTIIVLWGGLPRVSVVAQLRALLARQPEAKPQLRNTAAASSAKKSAQPKQDRRG